MKFKVVHRWQCNHWWGRLCATDSTSPRADDSWWGNLKLLLREAVGGYVEHEPHKEGIDEEQPMPEN